jgi:glycosyltransferase involved in cell wall biosynthesis
MKVTVVTVVKDDLTGLQKTARSILSQTIKVDWVVVTPPTPSETYEYVIELSMQGTIASIIADDGQGVYPAMNKAIDHLPVEGWLWFLNAGDEFSTENAYETVVNAAARSNRGWIYGGHFLGSDQGRIITELRAPISFNPANQLFAKKYVCHQSAIFKIALLKTLNGFDTRYKVAADWELMVRAWLLDPGQRIPETISVFYMGGLSTQNRPLANKELLEIRIDHLNPIYFFKNYLWFFYREARNKAVLSLEKKSPSRANSLREIRFGLKNYFHK